MVQKYIFPRTKETKKKETGVGVGVAARGQTLYKLPWTGERKKKKKKNPKRFEVKNMPKQKSNFCIKKQESFRPNM